MRSWTNFEPKASAATSSVPLCTCQSTVKGVRGSEDGGAGTFAEV